jgi:hypothetical protein
MYYSNYLEHESQTSKWDRVRVDYNLVKQVLQAKEHQTQQTKPKQVKVQSTVGV